MTVCSGCIQDFPHKEMYLVSRYMNRADPDKTNMIAELFCKGRPSPKSGTFWVFDSNKTFRLPSGSKNTHRGPSRRVARIRGFHGLRPRRAWSSTMQSPDPLSLDPINHGVKYFRICNIKKLLIVKTKSGSEQGAKFCHSTR